ncbi:MAG TPA: PTS galactitol transporter subunit IIBC [Elusimicrobia bacterium]|nr:MAG: hypothetical protein A2278_03195 [Elusimicrobia bacterium RIFOXYA12_FULL_49_49]OGS09681.1 MAG: hypothetical protein A2386_01255 [Elusimicrobia bacterium RIFOXYB1_FULL_48_9]OGS15570.1 MAG: hypothetical protein A2251_03445 [Elusimicrobia bacterium RIFOXYA2_FULL_47_53]OGS26874.1 MAG: hypothetical protein A2339_07535 [Elusimicrobia bacterium RIFOXYB12_FULL_50_12]OGS30669.1 MAG: hypothetical protein A2323_07250 [Elusimicrobia bacterium RIFOXYB2_FULL_46_23]HBU68858.1 PTS galactitol transport
MIKILVITHGSFGTEMVRTAENIVGKQDHVGVIAVNPEDSLSIMCKRTAETLESMESDKGILIFTDMLGGTPCNACLPYSINKNVEIVSGVNLYMLLSAFINRKNMDIKELVKKVLADGAKSITNAKELLIQKMK